MKIREIIGIDRSDLVGLVEMMIGDSNTEDVANEIVEDFYRNKLFSTFIIESESAIQGYISYKREPFEGSNKTGEIVFLGIIEDLRKQGYGKALVDYVEQYAKTEGIRKLYIKTNPLNNKRAVCFWIKRDYQFEARMKDFNFDEQDTYFMGKRL